MIEVKRPTDFFSLPFFFPVFYATVKCDVKSYGALCESKSKRAGIFHLHQLESKIIAIEKVYVSD